MYSLLSRRTSGAWTTDWQDAIVSLSDQRGI